MDKVLVTGGAGFIGSHISESLVRDGYKVTVLDNLSSGYERNLASVKDDVELIVGDIRDTGAVARAVKGARYVFHEAAMVSVPESVGDPIGCNAINGMGTVNVFFEASKAGVERVMFAASAAAYGSLPGLPKVETGPVDPVSPYAAEKLVGEHYCAVFTETYDMPCVPLRYFNVYGVRSDPSGPYAAVISKFLERMSGGQAPMIFGDGLQTRDFVHISDVVKANRLAMETPGIRAGIPINIGTGRQTSLLDLLNGFNAALGTSFEPIFKEERAGDVKHSVADISRARDILGYEPTMSLNDGLATLVEELG